MANSVQHEYFKSALLQRDDGTRHRLLLLVLGSATQVADDGLPDGFAWLIYMDSETALPYCLGAAELRAQFTPLEVPRGQPQPAKSSMSQLLKRASNASLKIGRQAWARIEPLVDNLEIFEPSPRNRLLKARALQAGGGTPKTLLKDLRRFWKGGQTEDALLGHYINSGRPGTVGTARRGAHAEDGRSAYQLTEDDLDNLRWAIEQYYFDKRVRHTLTQTLENLHFERYWYLDGNGVKCLKPETERPTYRQIEYFLHKNYTLEVRETARKGAKRFALEDRSTQGSIQLECHGVGHIYEFDASIVDVKLVAHNNRENIIGKPTLYLIIDRHSRLIVGFYLGFENPNFSAAMQAILSIGEPKDLLCERLGIPYDPDDWPADGVVPEMFLTDQGELVKKEARRIARSLRSTISNVPGMRPDWKPLVECGFMMLQQLISADTPAYVPDAEQKKRRGVNRDREASMTLKEFLAVIVMAIITHNKTPQVGYPLTEAQVEDEVRPIPRELWAHSVRRRMGLLDRMNYETLREELAPRSTATISEDGIEFNGLFYSCPEAEKLGWLVQGRRKRKALEIAFDYRLVDNIVVYNANGNGESFTASLTGDSVRFAGASFAQVYKYFVGVKKLTANAAQIKSQARFEYRLVTKPIIDAAIAATKAVAEGLSRSGRRADTAPARERELQNERLETPLIPAARPAPSRPAPATPVAPPPRPALPPPLATVVPIKHAKPQQTEATPGASAEQPTGAPAPSAKTLLQERLAAARVRLKK